MALGAQYGFTGSFEPSQDIAVALRYLSGAIGGFQGASSETSEEDGIVRSGYIRPPLRPDHQTLEHRAQEKTCGSGSHQPLHLSLRYVHGSVIM